jgi:hypothetical protein
MGLVNIPASKPTIGCFARKKSIKGVPWPQRPKK